MAAETNPVILDVTLAPALSLSDSGFDRASVCWQAN